MITHCGLPFSCIMFKHCGFIVMQLSREVLPNFSYLHLILYITICGKCFGDIHYVWVNGVLQYQYN
jgi:hypothetical protein